MVSTLGPTGKSDTSLHQDTAAALIGAMKAAGVRRFVGISGAGIDVPGDAKAFPDKVLSLLPGLLRSMIRAMIGCQASGHGP